MIREAVAGILVYFAVTILMRLYLESVMNSYKNSENPVFKQVGELYYINVARVAWVPWLVAFFWFPLLPLIVIFRVGTVILIILQAVRKND